MNNNNINIDADDIADTISDVISEWNEAEQNGWAIMPYAEEMSSEYGTYIWLEDGRKFKVSVEEV